MHTRDPYVGVEHSPRRRTAISKNTMVLTNTYKKLAISLALVLGRGGVEK